MINAIRIHEHGGPDVLRWEQIELPAPGPGEVRLRHKAIALNFSDINVRRGGFYTDAPADFPVIPGNEAAGEVLEVGAGVSGFAPGDRVGYVGVGGPFFENTGAYAEERNVPATSLIPLPDDITDQQAAASMLKGFTAASVINPVYTPKPGDWILIHTAASGVGMLLAQWSKHLGATVIGTVGSPEKAVIARANGCDHPILYRETDFVAAVHDLVPEGVSAVFDGVGKDTFVKSMDCTRPHGMLVNYGNASGHVPPIDLLMLSYKGSLKVCRPGIHHYIPNAAATRAAADELFGLIRAGVVRVAVEHVYPLADAARAHRDAEDRKITGSAVLIP
jgi:NADPH2:quinone reductase